ncbi:hypothetical protein U1Q18_030522, partial [Sarracenia purpurea var. burkii]
MAGGSQGANHAGLEGDFFDVEGSSDSRHSRRAREDDSSEVGVCFGVRVGVCSEDCPRDEFIDWLGVTYRDFNVDQISFQTLSWHFDIPYYMLLLDGSKAMQLFLSPLLKPTIRQQTIWFIRGFNSWSLAIRKASSPHMALQLYSQMQRLSAPFDSFSILFTLNKCAPLQHLSLIRHLHAHLLKLGFNSHVYVATSLLHAYVVSSFGDACALFDEMPERSVVTWNTMITGYAKSGEIQMARH